MTRILIKLLFIIPLILIIGYIGFNIYSSFYLPNTDYKNSSFTFDVESSETVRNIASKLEKEKVLITNNSLLLHNQFNPINNLQTGRYKITTPASPKDILDQITLRSSEIFKQKQELAKRKTVSVLFKEGETADDYIKKLSDAGLGTVKDLEDYIRTPKNFDKTVYPFLPEPLKCDYGNIKNCAKYYLEGYIYPDTYSFFVDAKIDEIFILILNNFDLKVAKKIDKSVTNEKITKAIIMASVIEKETGRPITGVDSTNIEQLNKERKNVASVFYNRLREGITWGSDPTVPYGSGKRICQSTLKINGCIYLNSPESDNLYNTYENKGYPIAPITSPQWDNILAALEPSKTNYLFFVSDGIGEKYFAVTNGDHENNIAKVQQINAKRVTK
jgi:UPF0755 protein